MILLEIGPSASALPKVNVKYADTHSEPGYYCINVFHPYSITYYEFLTVRQGKSGFRRHKEGYCVPA